MDEIQRIAIWRLNSCPRLVLIAFPNFQALLTEHQALISSRHLTDD
jgi:hypothetical protein